MCGTTPLIFLSGYLVCSSVEALLFQLSSSLVFFGSVEHFSLACRVASQLMASGFGPSHDRSPTRGLVCAFDYSVE